MTPQQPRRTTVLKLERVQTGTRNWEAVALEDILDYMQPTNYLVSSTHYRDEYETPVLTAGKSFLLGYTNEKEGIFPVDRLPVIIFDDFTTDAKFVNFPFKVKSSAMKILTPRASVDLYFVFHIMQRIKFDSIRHKRYWISQYSKLKILIPPLSEQKAIASILQKWDEAIEKTEALVSAKQKQFEWLIHVEITRNSYNKVTLGQICRKIKLVKHSSTESEEYLEIGDIDTASKSYDLSEKNKSPVAGSVKVPEGTLLISTVRPTRGAFCRTTSDIVVSSAFCRLKSPNEFVYYTLFQPHFVNFLASRQKGATYPTVRDEDILDFKVPLPPMSEQKRISHTLNTAQREIGLLRQLADRYRTQKRGLMQKLLTGEWRASA